MSDRSSILYPDDLPASSAPTVAPDWTAAAARLTRRAPEAPKPPDTAELLYSDDKPKPPEPPRTEEGEPKPKTDQETAREAQEVDVRSTFNHLAMDALKAGDADRVEELRAAETALVADFRAAGTDPAELNDALSIINERVYENRPVEQIEAERATVMQSLQVEYGPTLDSDLNAARAFVADLDRLSPGTKRSLELSGAGNDPKLIRQAIREAKRRGY